MIDLAETIEQQEKEIARLNAVIKLLNVAREVKPGALDRVVPKPPTSFAGLSIHDLERICNAISNPPNSSLQNSWALVSMVESRHPELEFMPAWLELKGCVAGLLSYINGIKEAVR